jgi:DNA-binding NtrC family response regulator
MSETGNNRAGQIRARVLVVDDEPGILRALRRALQDNYEVDAACCASEGADELCARVYDAVISDYQMPDHDGVWLLEVARDRQPKARRVLHTGSDVTHLGPCRESGLIERLLVKPSDAEQIREALRS